jgi:hypothetical protein
MNNWFFVGFSRAFLLGILIFKELTARRLYKSIGVKGLSSEVTQTRILSKFRQDYNRSRKFSLFISALRISIIIFTNAGHGMFKDKPHLFSLRFYSPFLCCHLTIFSHCSLLPKWFPSFRPQTLNSSVKLSVSSHCYLSKSLVYQSNNIK